jgi:hypothetical protein
MPLIWLKALYFFLVVSLVTIIISMSELYSIDLVRYEISFRNSLNIYEPGWKILGQLSSFLSFDQFLKFLYVFQACLIALIYKRSASIVFLPFVLLIIAPPLYTNQLRWGVATLLVILLSLQGYRFWAILGGVIFHKFAILLAPIPYFWRRLDHSFAVMVLVLLSSLSVFLLVGSIEAIFGFSYLADSNTSAGRSLIGLVFSVLVVVGYFSLPADRRRVEIKVLYIFHLMSAGFGWFAILSGRLSDATVILEPFLGYQLLINKTFFSMLIFFFLVASWIVRIYLVWAP